MVENIYNKLPCNYCDSNTHSMDICPKKYFDIAERVYEEWKSEVLEEKRCYKLGIKYERRRTG